jgi:diguanylate cyclase (GGDEF)-like protein
MNGNFNILSNNEIFDLFLEMELKRSLRYQNFISLLLIEANPRVGAARAEDNSTLSEKMAALIRKELRESDIVGTYNRNTVRVILLYSDERVSRKIADRLRTWMSNYFGVESNRSNVSLGDACFPSQANDLDCLYQKASEMLERAKAIDGNPNCSWG